MNPTLYTIAYPTCAPQDMQAMGRDAIGAQMQRALGEGRERTGDRRGSQGGCNVIVSDAIKLRRSKK